MLGKMASGVTIDADRCPSRADSYGARAGQASIREERYRNSGAGTGPIYAVLFREISRDGLVAPLGRSASLITSLGTSGAHLEVRRSAPQSVAPTS